MKNIFTKRMLSAVTAAAIAVSSFASMSITAMAFDAPTPDTGAAGGISGGGEWSIYNSKVGYNRTGTIGATIQDKSSDGTVEITGSAAISAAFQFDLSTMNSNAATSSDKVIKSAKLRLTPMVSKSGTKQVVYTINNAFNTTEGKTPIAEFTIPRGTGDDFNSDSNITSLTAEGMSEYPTALANWQTAVDVTGDVITAADNTISLLVSYSSGNANKTEYATSNVASNGRLNGGAVSLLYNSGLTDYSKWVYPQIVFEYTDKNNYKNALTDFTKAENELSAGKVTETQNITLSNAENGSTITLEMYGDTAQPIKVDGSSLVLNDEYTGNDACAYVKLIVTNTSADDTATYTKIIAVPAEYTRSNIISFDTTKNPKGEISVTSNGKTYTDGTAYAKQGGTFTVNDGANMGYKADISVTTTDAENPQTVSKNADGTYTMPGSDVNVSVTYSKKKTYGTARIAAVNSASVQSNNTVKGSEHDITIGAGRLAFLKFNLSEYNENLIASVKLSFEAKSTSEARTTAIFYIPNNEWTETEGLSADFCIKKDDTSTKLGSFGTENVELFGAYDKIAPDVTSDNKDDKTTDLSSAANGVLNGYFLGSYGVGLTLDVTAAIKAALERNVSDNSGDGTITLMIYSPRSTGLDIKSIATASGLDTRPSLTITETSENLPDEDLVTEINTMQDLENFAAIVSGGNDYAGKTVTLNNDIVLSEKYNADGETWAPIGTYDSELGTQAFAGTFAGNNHTISGLYINEQSVAQGLFGAVSGNIKDLTVKGEINGSSVIGGIAGFSSGTIENCHSEVNITAEREAGGIVGTLSNGGSISNCDNSGNIEIKDKETYAGGIAAHNIGGIIENCHNTGEVKNGLNGFRNRLGGIVGYLDNGEVNDSYNTGNVKSEAETSTYVADETKNYVGGIAGYSQNGIITNCRNTGAVCNAVDYAGGIAGYLHSEDIVSKSYNEGNVSGKGYIGGIVGSNDSTISDCYNTGDVSGTGEYIGGAVGYLSSGDVKNCYSTGNVTGDNNAGSVIGFNSSGNVKNCYYIDTCSKDDNYGVSKTAAELSSGEVTHLLQDGQTELVWGQTIKGSNLDTYPILTSDDAKKVCKVTFGVQDNENEGQYKEYAAAYTNLNNTVTLPTAPTDSGNILKFAKWSQTNSTSGEEFTESTSVTADITVYAVGETTYGEADGEKKVTATYGVATTQDLSKYSDMADDTETTDKFTYSIESGNDTLGASVSDDTLTIPNTAPAGNYTLTIKAHKKSSDYAIMTASLDTTDFEFTVTVKVDKANPTVTAPQPKELHYTGEEFELVTAGETSGGEIQYKLGTDGVYSTAIPKASVVGEYTVYYKVVGNDNYNDVEEQSVAVKIDKTRPDVTAPQAKTGLVYDGTEKALVDGGSVTGGTMQYSLEENGTYNETIPTGINAGNYTVYYKVTGDENHGDISPVGIPVTIAKAEGAASVTMADYNCGGAASVNPSPVSATNGTDNVTYSYKAKDADDSTYTTEKPDTAGNYVVRALFAETNNYNSVTATSEFSISHSYSSAWSKDETNHWHECACGEKSDEAAHTWNSGEITTEATCTEAGVKTFTCSVCGQTKTESIDATGHNYGAWSISVEPTMETQGEAQRICANDNSHIDKVTLPSLTDTTVWTAGMRVEPTETEDGSQEYTSDYGTVTIVLTALGHTHDWDDWSITIEPTLTETGTAQRVCKLNNTHIDSITLPILTDTTVWTVGTRVEPTETEDGSQEYTSDYGTITIVLPAVKPLSYKVEYTDGEAIVTVPETGTYTVIFAAYDANGVLIGVEFRNITTETVGEQPPVTPKKLSMNSAEKVKVMLWDSIIGMKPLCAADTK